MPAFPTSDEKDDEEPIRVISPEAILVSSQFTPANEGDPISPVQDRLLNEQ